MKRLRRIGFFVSAMLAVSYALMCLGFYWAMRQTPERFGHIMARTPIQIMAILPFETLWTRARAGALSIGEPAPDFRLPTLDRKDEVRISAFRGLRPVVLVFGSYT